MFMICTTQLHSGCELYLVPKERVHVHAVVYAPGLDCAVQSAAEQLMRALPEGQACDGIPMAWKALHASSLLSAQPPANYAGAV